MSSHEIVVATAHVERCGIAGPKNHIFWDGLEEKAKGRHALVLGTLDDAIVMPGTLDTIANVARSILGEVDTWRAYEETKAKQKAAKKAAKAAERAAKAAPVEPTEVPGPAGSFITEFLRPGAELRSGGTLGEGQHGVRLIGDFEITGSGAELAELGDQVSAHFPSPRVLSVAHAADMMAAAGEDDAWCGFGCGEVDGIAGMLATHGHLVEAGAIIAAHACNDDGGDPHGYIGAVGGWQTRQEAAEVYVRRLMGETDAQPADVEAKREWLVTLEDELRQVRQELGMPVEDL